MEYELIENSTDRCAMAPRRDGGLAEDAAPQRPERPLIEPHDSHWPERDGPLMHQMGEG